MMTSMFNTYIHTHALDYATMYDLHLFEKIFDLELLDKLGVFLCTLREIRVCKQFEFEIYNTMHPMNLTVIVHNSL